MSDVYIIDFFHREELFFARALDGSQYFCSIVVVDLSTLCVNLIQRNLYKNRTVSRHKNK